MKALWRIAVSTKLSKEELAKVERLATLHAGANLSRFLRDAIQAYAEMLEGKKP